MTELGCEVLVVGGGIAGVSVAALAAAERAVILTEAEAELSRHSTGRSAAAYLPSYGTDLVRALTLASRADYDELSESAGTPLLTPRPLVWLARDDPGAAQLATLAGLMPELEALTGGDAQLLCPVLRPDAIRGGLLDLAAADIDVAALHASYVAQIRARGGRIIRSAPLRSAARTGAGWRVRCGDHTVTCDVIVDAAGAWADEVAAACGIDPIGVIPCRRSAFIVPLPADGPGCRDWPLVIDGGAGCYFRPEGADRLLASPGDETPVEPGDARPDELAIAQALD
jgi:D-arginine dehydrogenase